MIPFGGGTSVVGGVEPRVGDAYPGVGDDRPRPPRPRARGRPRLRRGADPGRRARAAPRGPAPRARAHAAPLPAVLRVLHRSGGWIATRAGGHFATLYTHIDDLVESVRALTPRGDVGEPPAAGVRGGPEPRPHAARIGGDPRGDHGGLGPGSGAAALEALGRRRLRRRSRPAPRRCATSRSRACIRPTAGFSTRPRRRSPTRGRRARRSWSWASSRPTILWTGRCRPPSMQPGRRGESPGR